LPLALVVGLWGHARWARIDTQGRMRALEASTLPAQGAPSSAIDEADLGVTAPRGAALLWCRVLNPNQPVVRQALPGADRHVQRQLPKGEQWEPFTARQRVSTKRPGFVWDASISMPPGIPVRVVDAYVAGGMGSLAAVGVRAAGSWAALPGLAVDMARGELIRFFAEAVWYPTALLPSQGVQWVAGG
jgi:hypothetical protein